MDQREKEKFKELLLNLPPNPDVEQIAVPPLWKPCYIKAQYTPEDIENNIMIFSTLLDLDIENSTVATRFRGQTTSRYASTPAKYQDISGLLCSCPDTFGFTYGLEIIDNKGFLLMVAGDYVQAIDINIPTDQIKKLYS